MILKIIIGGDDGLYHLWSSASECLPRQHYSRIITDASGMSYITFHAFRTTMKFVFTTSCFRERTTTVESILHLTTSRVRRTLRLAIRTNDIWLWLRLHERTLCPGDQFPTDGHVQLVTLTHSSLCVARCFRRTTMQTIWTTDTVFKWTASIWSTC